MNSIQELFFILSLIAVQLLVKIGAQTEGCDRTYTNLSGTISSPNYPSNYDDNLDCTYDIQVPSQKSVNITFISFDTETNVDWLEISYDSYEDYEIPYQGFTGHTLPPFLSISFCSTVKLWFYTDDSETRQGFSLKYDIGSELQGGLTMKPMNRYVRSDWPTTEATILSCSSRANQAGEYPWWSYSRDGCSFSSITASDCSVLPSIYDSDPNYFTTSTQYSTRTCNLTISAQYINDAVGFYACTDATLDYASALVYTIDFDFTVEDFSSSENEVVQGDQISMTCDVRLFNMTSSCFQLTPYVYIYSGNNYQRPLKVSNSTASVNVTASAEVLPPYVCNINFTLTPLKAYSPSKFATNLPQNISSTKTSPSVLYWPESTSMVINGDDNGRVVANGNLTCYVPANPPAIYQWTTKEYGFPSGPTVTVSHNETYTCTATNVIRGKTYVASKSINITTTIIDGQKNESDNKSLIVGVVLGIVVLLLLVVAIVEFVLLWRKKNSPTMDVNYDFIDAVIRTDAEPAKPHVYELSQRGRLDVDQRGAVGTSGHRGVPPIPPMYDRITDQTYDTEIHTEDNSQPYDTEIHTEDKSQEILQTYDTEMSVHTEDKSDPYLALNG